MKEPSPEEKNTQIVKLFTDCVRITSANNTWPVTFKSAIGRMAGFVIEHDTLKPKFTELLASEKVRAIEGNVNAFNDLVVTESWTSVKNNLGIGVQADSDDGQEG